ncbi:MAG: lipoyl(octanoyl) transferase [Omnitrophica WOR_2 bacterium RIFOXYC2_FULL_45_15]|nr:MAG: lipoyl(octanoyl) transferase [Omnitrophica WOR_2 bacterium RIFOXYC2_FULL_45_15]
MSSGFDFEVLDLGLIDYQKGFSWQQDLVNEIASGKRKGVLIFCEHSPVITLGRSAKKENVLKPGEQLKSLGIEVVAANRGGDVTLHLPGQLVVYPVFNLRYLGRDIGLFLRNIEKAVISLLNDYRIKATALEGSTGVWVEQKKIASIGIAVKNWVAYHGVSLNINCNLDLFSLIRPCGQDIIMTSMARFIHFNDLNVSEIKIKLADKFKQVFTRCPAS